MIITHRGILKSWMHGFVKKAGTLVLLVTCMQALTAQTVTSDEYKVKAVFLYNFTRFVDWPQSTFESSVEPFIIGIVGNDPFGASIQEAVADERIGAHVIKVIHFDDAVEISKCHILYVGTSDPDEIRNILSRIKGKSILTVSDIPNFIRWDGMIRFYTENNRIRLEINNTRAKEAGLRISSKLLRVANVL